MCKHRCGDKAKCKHKCCKADVIPKTPENVKSKMRFPLMAAPPQASPMLKEGNSVLLLQQNMSFLSPARAASIKPLQKHNLHPPAAVNKKPLTKEAKQKLRRRTTLDRESANNLFYPPAQQEILELCEQENPDSIEEMLSPLTVIKIGEGSFGEVYACNLEPGDRKKSPATSAWFRWDGAVIVKIVPVGGDAILNGEQVASWEAVCDEVSVLKKLGKLNLVNIIDALSVKIMKGPYPHNFVLAGNNFEIDFPNDALNECPSKLPRNQHYAVIVMDDGGEELNGYHFKTGMQSVAVLRQLILALATAEQQLQFEHRDLHSGNVLIAAAAEDDIKYSPLGSDGPNFEVETAGIIATIIDFSLAFIKSDAIDDKSHYRHLDDSFFTGSGDYQFDIYRMMQAETKGQWDKPCPRTNVFWLHYIADKLVNDKMYKRTLDKDIVRQHEQAMEQLSGFLKDALDYTSARDLALKHPIVTPCIVHSKKSQREPREPRDTVSKKQKAGE